MTVAWNIGDYSARLGVVEDKGFDFESTGHYVRVPQHNGKQYVVHDLRCRWAKDSGMAIPPDDIGEPRAANGRIQVCCAHCRRKGWLWDWQVRFDDGWD